MTAGDTEAALEWKSEDLSDKRIQPPITPRIVLPQT